MTYRELILFEEHGMYRVQASPQFEDEADEVDHYCSSLHTALNFCASIAERHAVKCVFLPSQQDEGAVQ